MKRGAKKKHPSLKEKRGTTPVTETRLVSVASHE